MKTIRAEQIVNVISSIILIFETALVFYMVCSNWGEYANDIRMLLFPYAVLTIGLAIGMFRKPFFNEFICLCLIMFLGHVAKIVNMTNVSWLLVLLLIIAGILMIYKIIENR